MIDLPCPSFPRRRCPERSRRAGIPASLDSTACHAYQRVGPDPCGLDPLRPRSAWPIRLPDNRHRWPTISMADGPPFISYLPPRPVGSSHRTPPAHRPPRISYRHGAPESRQRDERAPATADSPAAPAAPRAGQAAPLGHHPLLPAPSLPLLLPHACRSPLPHPCHTHDPNRPPLITPR